MFRIIQSLNNNAALVKNEKGEQAVVMGLGITFQKKKGDLVVKEKIENIFALKNAEAKENFLTLLKAQNPERRHQQNIAVQPHTR